jgi:hypothetical protein
VVFQNCNRVLQLKAYLRIWSSATFGREAEEGP